MRKILHVDLDAFFCSVEELMDPTLRDVAFATGGTADGRGVVTSCSYAARIKGVRSAMPMAIALRMCPELRTVSGHHSLYSEYSSKVMEVFSKFTPLVEPISIDEAFLDVSDLPQPPKEIATEIQMRVRRKTGLPCSIGAAGSKLVAKIATNIGKSGHNKPYPPMAINVVPQGTEKEFLKPLLIREMWGIGPKSAKHLNACGIVTLGDIQAMKEEELKEIVGNFAATLKRRALGIDERLVGDNDSIKSVSNERTFFDNISDRNELMSIVRSLCQKVGRRLRRRGLNGKTVRIKLRWADYTTITRQQTLPQPTNHDSVIFEAAKKLVLENWAQGKKVRLVGVGVSNLESDFQQLSLFEHSFEKERELLKAIDDLQEKYGSDIIHKGPNTKSDL